MKTKEHSGKFTFTSPINLETSFNVTPVSDNAKSEIEVDFLEDETFNHVFYANETWVY